MARKLLERSDIFPYHVFARSNNRDWFSAPLSQIYGMFANLSETVVQMYGFELHAFVLMSNHFHMALSTPRANLDKGMQYLMTQSSKGIARMSNRINKIYGARYRWTIVKDPIHYAYVVKYIYRNPVKANVVLKAEEYRWSTLNTAHRKFSNIVVSNSKGFQEYLHPRKEDFLRWVNNEFVEEHENAIQAGIKKSVFKLPRNSNGFKITLPDPMLHKK